MIEIYRKEECLTPKPLSVLILTDHSVSLVADVQSEKIYASSS
jgi:hypothetical protein